ncbi:hypothetical protein LTR64_002339 [Lithohypha guttulata]|uniref:uncharacterized protein n=1 Tax=Lithohypha guttulata TaxID=1690604 RepID=UPI00315D0941
MATKILVVGPVNGQFEKAFSKISKLHAKTDFAFALVAGNLFGPGGEEGQLQALLSGSLSIPLPTYFTIGDTALPQTVQERLEANGEVCSNLLYLGRKGTLTTTEGVKIIFLGGKQVQNEDNLTQSIGKYDPLFLENEARALQGAHSAHILLTNQWCARIENGSNIPLPEDVQITQSSIAVANLCATLKPRYQFCPSTSTSWKREPFVWPMDYSENAETQVTRFEALGDISQKASDWISAFTLDISKPATSEGAQRAAPFTLVSPRGKRKRNALEADPYPGRRFDTTGNNHHGRKNKKHKQSYDPNNCFMCLGKPQFAAEMVVSIADESFITSLRGTLPTQSTFPQLKSSGNLMIIPMYHAADETSHGKRARSEMESEFREMTRYRHALQHMLQARGNSQLGAVCWEVNRTGIRHFHWQWIACPQDMVGKGLVEAAFKIAAEKNDHEKFHICDPDQLLLDRGSDYFRVWIWSSQASLLANGNKASNGNANGNKDVPITSSLVEQADAIAAGVDERSVVPPGTSETSMYFELPSDQRFNVQFGRTVMSGLLKLENRADWRSVPLEDGDEGRDAEAWKEDLGEFDFAMA